MHNYGVGHACGQIQEEAEGGGAEAQKTTQGNVLMTPSLLMTTVQDRP